VTEKEWLACATPLYMLNARAERISDRKLRLFAVACCRRVWDRLPEGRHRDVVDLAERHAEGLLSQRVWQSARQTDLGVATHRTTADDVVGYVLHKDPRTAARATSGNASTLAVEEAVLPAGPDRPRFQVYLPAQHAVLKEFAALLRCIAGERYRLPRLKPSWLTSDVVALARGIYDERAFDRMPILADALQDAGCDNDDILNHCRGSGPHVRGCWVVDMLLGKA
jgi:hypothetical protein